MLYRLVDQNDMLQLPQNPLQKPRTSTWYDATQSKNRILALVNTGWAWICNTAKSVPDITAKQVTKAPSISSQGQGKQKVW